MRNRHGLRRHARGDSTRTSRGLGLGVALAYQCHKPRRKWNKRQILTDPVLEEKVYLALSDETKDAEIAKAKALASLDQSSK